jgi:hypothetical protein
MDYYYMIPAYSYCILPIDYFWWFSHVRHVVSRTVKSAMRSLLVECGAEKRNFGVTKKR